MTVVADHSEKGVSEEEVWPPGFRFHPTDEELVLYYLKRKICRRKIKLGIIGETDVYKWDPEELPGLSSLKTGDRQWFFFSPRDRKYPNGARSNRATRHGYWKATGKDRIVICNARNVGVKKTLVFYKGRAPSGSRTDWVMHEYTLDEEEFKRCQNVKGYYALYKVFKKSGLGPKNGEQYGAPFKEEDWADVEYHGFSDSDCLEIPLKKLNEVASVADERGSGEYLPSLDDIEELMNQIPDGPVFDSLEDNDNLYFRPQIFGQEAESTVVDPSSRDVFFFKQDKILHSSDQLCDVQRSLDFTNSAIAQLPSSKICEVSSTFAPNCPNCYEGQSQVLAEEDFLEIDDLIGSERSIFVPVKPANNLLIENMDALGELDMFHDTAMFLHDLGSIDHGTVSEIYLTEHKKSMANQLECQLQSNSDCLNQSTNPLWIGDQPSNIFDLSESHQAYASQPTAGNEGDNDGGAVSLLSSSLWSFIESIPTTPASASEHTLVNRAFERMSSFKKLTINPRNSQVSIDSDIAWKNRAGKEVLSIFSLSRAEMEETKIQFGIIGCADIAKVSRATSPSQLLVAVPLKRQPNSPQMMDSVYGWDYMDALYSHSQDDRLFRN